MSKVIDEHLYWKVISVLTNNRLLVALVVVLIAVCITDKRRRKRELVVAITQITSHVNYWDIDNIFSIENENRIVEKMMSLSPSKKTLEKINELRFLFSVVFLPLVVPSLA